MTYTEATPNCNKGMGTATIDAAQGNPIQHTEATVTKPTMTHLTSYNADHQYSAAHQVTTLRTTVNQVHTHPSDHQNIIPTTEDHTVPDCTSTREPKNHTLVGIKRSIWKKLHQITMVQMIIPPIKEKKQSLN